MPSPWDQIPASEKSDFSCKIRDQIPASEKSDFSDRPGSDPLPFGKIRFFSIVWDPIPVPLSSRISPVPPRRRRDQIPGHALSPGLPTMDPIPVHRRRRPPLRPGIPVLPACIGFLRSPAIRIGSRPMPCPSLPRDHRNASGDFQAPPLGGASQDQIPVCRRSPRLAGSTALPPTTDRQSPVPAADRSCLPSRPWI